MDTLTYWNGTWHEGNPAILGPRDHAFWLGSMVFDGGRAFEGCGPDLDLHAERVVRSARALGLKPTKTAAEILELMHEGVRRFGPKAELYVRSEEHTSELQSLRHLVCRLLLEKT